MLQSSFNLENRILSTRENQKVPRIKGLNIKPDISFNSNVSPKRQPLTPSTKPVITPRTFLINKQEPISTRNFHPTTNIANIDLSLNTEKINIYSLLNSNNIPLSIDHLNQYFPFYEQTKYSSKSLTHIKAYAVNTCQGVIRTYNEDRVSIILNIIKPATFKGEHWPKCSFFGIYDGHGGNGCADYLRDNLHQFVL
jgi:hypothetical protein